MKNPPAAALRGPSPIDDLLLQLHARHAGLDAGEVADYIPELAKADPAGFGIVIATVDGHVYEVGDSRRPFTIQSVSKPLAYGVALEDRGRDAVLAKVGVEPSGEAFNSISLEPGTGRPLNPMINAGAIAVASLIPGDTPQARLSRIVGAMSAYAGRPLDIDEAVYESERATGHRNRAIGHMLRSHGIIEGDPEPALELYFRQCSVLVDCRDLALMGATLANGGVHPVTGVSAVPREYIGSILSVMATCGIYDFTGEWVYRVGFPAKSGVGGGILAVLPGQLGIGVYSPRLDERGNSVRGVAVCQALSTDLGLHVLEPPRPSTGTVRARYTLAQVQSKRRWPPAATQLLADHGSRALVYELQGDLHFSTVEPLLREVTAAAESMQCLLLDFQRVTHVDGPAAQLLARMIENCGARGQQVMLSRVRRGEVLAGFDERVDPRHARAYAYHAPLDLALEACERALLAKHGAGSLVPSAIESLAKHRLCAGAAAEDVAYLGRLVHKLRFDQGDMLFERGDRADALFLLMRGEVSVTVRLPGGGVKRLATLTAGMVFGESALLTGGGRTADVRADTDVECLALPAETFARLEVDRPALMARLLHNLLKSSAETTTRLTTEVAALEA